MAGSFSFLEVAGIGLADRARAGRRQPARRQVIVRRHFHLSDSPPRPAGSLPAAQTARAIQNWTALLFGGGGGNPSPRRVLQATPASAAADVRRHIDRNPAVAPRPAGSLLAAQTARAIQNWTALLFGGGGGNRTRVRKPYTARTTCLARSFGSRPAPAGRQADAWPVTSTDPRGQVTRPRRGADVNDAAPGEPGLAHQQTSAASRRC